MRAIEPNESLSEADVSVIEYFNLHHHFSRSLEVDRDRIHIFQGSECFRINMVVGFLIDEAQLEGYGVIRAKCHPVYRQVVRQGHLNYIPTKPSNYIPTKPPNYIPQYLMTIIFYMENDDFEVILNQKDYEQLKSYKELSASHEREIGLLRTLLEDKEKTIERRLLDLYIKDEQIKYLVSLFERLSSEANVEHLGCLDSMMQSTYLNICMYKPEEQVDHEVLKEEISQKYSNQAEIIASYITKHRSQEFLLKEFQNSNCEKEERVKNAESVLLKTVSLQTGLPLNGVPALITLLKSHKEQSAVTKDLKAQLKEQKDLLQQSRNQLGEATKKVYQYMASEKNLIERVKVYQKALKKEEIPQKKSKNALNDLKLNIDQYIRQIEVSLKAVPGLQEEERRTLVKMELKDLVIYIEKSANN